MLSKALKVYGWRRHVFSSSQCSLRLLNVVRLVVIGPASLGRSKHVVSWLVRMVGTISQWRVVVASGVLLSPASLGRLLFLVSTRVEAQTAICPNACSSDKLLPSSFERAIAYDNWGRIVLAATDINPSRELDSSILQGAGHFAMGRCRRLRLPSLSVTRRRGCSSLLIN